MMKSMMRVPTLRLLLRTGLLACLMAAALTMQACNTIHGAGKDIEKGGQLIQESTGQKAQDW